MSRKQVSITANVADGAITWYRVTGNEGLGIAVTIASGTGTITLKRQLSDGTAQTVLDNDTALAYSASFGNTYGFVEGDIVGLGVSSASSLVATAVITGRFVEV